MENLKKSETYDETLDAVLCVAAMTGPAQVVKTLIDQGANINTKVNDGMTPLHVAATNGHEDVANLLIAEGADINAKGNNGGTPLHFAAMNGFNGVVKLLIIKGANVKAKANDGLTPLDLAVYNDHKETAEFIKKACKDVNLHEDEKDKNYMFNHSIAEFVLSGEAVTDPKYSNQEYLQYLLPFSDITFKSSKKVKSILIQLTIPSTSRICNISLYEHTIDEISSYPRGIMPESIGHLTLTLWRDGRTEIQNTFPHIFPGIEVSSQ